jgi:DNA-binding IclR family transcriptional regulator
MTEADIAPEIRNLLRGCVDTYEKLDVLLLLWRKQVALELSEIADALALGARATQEAVAHLQAAGLVFEEQRDRFRYRPRLGAQRSAVDGLAHLFESDPVRIVQWMSRNAFDRLHSSAASAFAEAVLSGKKNRE